LAVFLFFVDFEICNPQECKLEIQETRKLDMSIGGNAFQPAPARILQRVPAPPPPISPPWPIGRTVARGIIMSKRKTPIEDCTHTLIVADMPGWESILIPVPPMPSSLVFGLSVTQRLIVTDVKTAYKFETSHDVTIGFTTGGGETASP
jgi:hypothetical protein